MHRHLQKAETDFKKLKEKAPPNPGVPDQAGLNRLLNQPEYGAYFISTIFRVLAKPSPAVMR